MEYDRNIPDSPVAAEWNTESVSVKKQSFRLLNFATVNKSKLKLLIKINIQVLVLASLPVLAWPNPVKPK